MIYETDFEMECIRKRLIMEKEQEIKKLKEEIEELRHPKNLKELVNREIVGVKYWDDNSTQYVINWAGHYGWEGIKKACIYLWKPKHKKDQMKVRNLSLDELTISARMAEEMIDVWNKYICEIYGEPEVQE